MNTTTNDSKYDFGRKVEITSRTVRFGGRWRRHWQEWKDETELRDVTSIRE